MSSAPESKALAIAAQTHALAAAAPPPPPMATPLMGMDPGIPWARYRAAIWRYKWLVLLMTALGTAGGVMVMRLMRPVYDVHATLWISTDARSPSRGCSSS